MFNHPLIAAAARARALCALCGAEHPAAKRNEDIRAPFAFALAEAASGGPQYLRHSVQEGSFAALGDVVDGATFRHVQLRARHRPVIPTNGPAQGLAAPLGELA